MRGEDKEESRGLGEGSYFCFVKLCKRWKRRRKIGRPDCFGELSQGTVVARNFGLGGQETARIPGARSWRGCSQLDGRLIFSWVVWASSRTREPGTKSTNL
jgi:hypothetical protein